MEFLDGNIGAAKSRKREQKKRNEFEEKDAKCLSVQSQI